MYAWKGFLPVADPLLSVEMVSVSGCGRGAPLPTKHT